MVWRLNRRRFLMVPGQVRLSVVRPGGTSCNRALHGQKRWVNEPGERYRGAACRLDGQPEVAADGTGAISCFVGWVSARQGRGSHDFEIIGFRLPFSFYYQKKTKF